MVQFKIYKTVRRSPITSTAEIASPREAFQICVHDLYNSIATSEMDY
jgi:hypothetical protein